MKKIIVFLFVISICSLVFAKNKDVIYDKDTKEIIAVKISERPATEAGKVDIVCEGRHKEYGVNKEKILTISVDEKTIPAVLEPRAYKINTDTKEIYKEVILEE